MCRQIDTETDLEDAGFARTTLTTLPGWSSSGLGSAMDADRAWSVICAATSRKLPAPDRRPNLRSQRNPPPRPPRPGLPQTPPARPPQTPPAAPPPPRPQAPPP